MGHSAAPSGANVKGALPLGTVLTLPATGSECNGGSVISRRETQEKLFFLSPHAFPVFSVLDPETTFTLPSKQVRNGIVDAFVHVCEQYMTYPAAAPLQDRLAESILQTLVEVGPVTLAEPQNYDARATFMWSATLALNNLIGSGVPQDWTSHMIGHELTAYYGLDHAETLAIVLLGVWRHKLAQKRAKLEQYGRRVWNVSTAEEAIEKTEAFFHALGMPTRLSDYQITAADAAEKVRGTVCSAPGGLRRTRRLWPTRRQCRTAHAGVRRDLPPVVIDVGLRRPSACATPVLARANASSAVAGL